ncbi:MAG: hypothetical protein QXG65_05710 [Thermoplasmata archaeon]
MTAEMISGPDLGGGYLHQLTLESGEGPARFTYHAQIGGPDANGPPLGPLEPLGFRHPKSPCPFGGPRCWHRGFELPASHVGRVRQAYNRFRFCLEAMLAQCHAGRPPAIAMAVETIAARLGEVSRVSERFWYIGGSTAAWLQGAEVDPRDIDLGTAAVGIDAIGSALAEFLIEPIATTDWEDGRSVVGARAFVGTMREGARVEWSVPRGDDPAADPEFDPRIDHVAVRRIHVGEHAVWVSRPEYALLRALLRGREEAAQRLARAVETLGPDRPLLARLLRDDRVPPAIGEWLAARFGLSDVPMEP